MKSTLVICMGIASLLAASPARAGDSPYIALMKQFEACQAIEGYDRCYGRFDHRLRELVERLSRNQVPEK